MRGCGDKLLKTTASVVDRAVQGGDVAFKEIKQSLDQALAATLAFARFLMPSILRWVATASLPPLVAV